jgi:hypothetical protein
MPGPDLTLTCWEEIEIPRHLHKLDFLIPSNKVQKHSNHEELFLFLICSLSQPDCHGMGWFALLFHPSPPCTTPKSIHNLNEIHPFPGVSQHVNALFAASIDKAKYTI